MCIRCKDAHHRNRLSRKHTCQSLQEALSEPVKSFLKHFCKDHPDHKIEFYCEQCSSLCCVSCSIVRHKGHDLDFVEDAANTMLSSLKTEVENVKKSAFTLRRKKRSLVQEYKDHEKVSRQTTFAIDQYFDELMRKINLRRTMLVTEVQEKTATTLNRLTKQREATEDTFAQMDSVQEYIKQIESKSDDCEVLSAGPVLVHALEAADAVDQVQDVRHQTWTFWPGDVDDINATVYALGRIYPSTNSFYEEFDYRDAGGTVLEMTKQDSIEGFYQRKTLSETPSSITLEECEFLEGDGDKSADSESFVHPKHAPITSDLKTIDRLERWRSCDLSHIEDTYRRETHDEHTPITSTFRRNAITLSDSENEGPDAVKELAVTRIMKQENEFKSADRAPGGRYRDPSILYDRGSYRKDSNSSDSPLINEPYVATFAANTKEFDFKLPRGLVVKVHRGDILKVGTDAIINATDSKLQHHAGVARAITKTCGRNLERKCQRHIVLNGPLNVGELMHTTAGDLIASGTRYVLHTVGPAYATSKSPNLLTCTFRRCLDYGCQKLRIRSIALPFINSGEFRIPLDLCVESFLDAVMVFAKTHKDETSLEEIHLIDTDRETVNIGIVMIKQHLEKGFDVLTRKAFARLENKSDNTESEQSEEQRTTNLT